MQSKNPIIKTLIIYVGGMVGFILGAIVGGFIAALLGLGLLLLVLTLTHTSGDQATGMGGLIVLVVPLGLIIGGGFGCIQGMKCFGYFGSSEDK